MNLLLMKLDDKRIEILKKAVRYLLQFFIVGYLIYQLNEIGLSQIINSLPLKPLFYLLFLLIYFSLPLAEVIIYRFKWPLTLKNSFPVFIQKKVLNTDVVGYSGEVYLFHWAKTYLGKTTSEALHFIKDNNILSSVASTVITVLLLLFFITQGYINIYDYIGEVTLLNWILIGSGVSIAGFVIYKFRDKIIALNTSDSLKIFSLHAFRIVLINILQIFQWHVALPDISLSVWFTFSAVQILASRIPFLPSKDVLFVNVALEMTGVMAISREVLVGVLTANLILQRIINVISYLTSNIYQKKGKIQILDEEENEFHKST